MPSRVLYLAWAPFFSGAERALLVTLRALNPDLYAPYVLAGTEGEFAQGVRDSGFTCEIADIKPFDLSRPVVSLASILSVVRAARRHRVDLIHSNEVPSFQPGGYAARMLGLPSVTHVRFPDTRAGFQWFLRSRFSRALFVSRDLMTGALTEAPELFTGRSQVLYDGVEPRRPWTQEELEGRRGELGLPGDRPLVAITGQIAEVKGIWDFVAAAEILSREGSNALFVVLGDDLKTGGEQRRAMEQRVRDLGLADRFRFLGFRHDAPELVQAFDLVVVPSHVEPLGNATLEAMAAGRPVVGTRVGGIPEMVVDRQTGVLSPAKDPRALAAAIAQVLADPAERLRMAAAARARATDVFGPAAHSLSLQGCYDELRAGTAARSRARSLFR